MRGSRLNIRQLSANGEMNRNRGWPPIKGVTRSTRRSILEEPINGGYLPPTPFIFYFFKKGKKEK